MKDIFNIVENFKSILGNHRIAKFEKNPMLFRKDLKRFLKESISYDFSKEFVKICDNNKFKIDIISNKKVLIRNLADVIIKSMNLQNKFGNIILETNVAGARFAPNISEILSNLYFSTKLDLKFEPLNPYDKNAIKLLYKGEKIGYIPKDETKLIRKLLKRGKLNTYVKFVNWHKEWIEIEIYICKKAR